jgi:predicted transposase YbfD/YdcC
MDRFEAWFGEVPDPRAANIRHNLLEVMFIALAAVLCGAEDCTDIATFARARRDWLETILDLPHGPPSHDTFSRVFRLLEPGPFAKAFAHFSRAFARELKGVVAIDGKALRGAYGRGARTSPLHTVNIWAAQTRLTLASTLAPGRNEIAGALEALALVSLEGCILTADALYCRPDIAASVRQRGGDYVLSVKANRPKLAALLAKALASPRARKASAGPALAHDRVETRTAKVIAIPGLAKACGLAGACAGGEIVSRRRGHGGRQEKLTRRFVLSRRLGPKQLLAVVRQHWGVENRLHRTLDIAFREDASRTRMGNGAVNLSLVRKLALNLIHAVPGKASIKTKVKEAAWSNDALNAVLAHMR